MKFIVIGLGSMGKRRVRNLKALGYGDITGFDAREDRRREAEKLYGIKTAASLDSLKAFDAAFISLPPELHMQYAQKAYESKINAFIEAGVFDDGLKELSDKVKAAGLKFYASCSFRFHPLIKKIKQLVDAGGIGKILNFSYHCGSYLPEWHPWESMKDFYVSKRLTGAAREMTLFELSWINWIVGELAEAKAFISKLSDMDADIDDVYAMTLKYKNGVLGTFMQDVVSRNSVRNLVLNGDKGQIIWQWDDRMIKLYNAGEKSWTHYIEPVGAAAAGYNPLIVEEMYIAEVKAFIDAIKNNTPVANSLDDDLKNVACIRIIEKS